MNLKNLASTYSKRLTKLNKKAGPYWPDIRNLCCYDKSKLKFHSFFISFINVNHYKFQVLGFST
ncbi:hypothetical protein SC439_13220, partial [Legionella pneumophila serogroup 1]